MKRNDSIDFMRGLVMIIMALDHVRDMLHLSSLTQSPTDLNTTNTALFFTRWVTYLCAPTFVFLSGASAFLSLQARNDVPAARRFLLTRGLWLIVLEFTLVNFGMWFDLRFSFLIFEVIAAIGVGFIILALLISLPQRVIGITGLTILALHNLVAFSPSANASLPMKLLSSLFLPGAWPYAEDRLFFMGYPPVPWLGIMLVGFGAGKTFLLPQDQQSSVFLKAGLAALGLFLLIRLTNVYGDPALWAVQEKNLFTVLSFLNVTKYPPSLLFCLLFLGLMCLVLSAAQGLRARWVRRVTVYGRTPLFYFLVHWYIIHPLVFVMVFVQGFSPGDLVFGSSFGRPASGSGIALWAVYLVWAGIVLLMYPLCSWYGRYKARHPDKKWLRYL
ncbi:hypothetical protein C7T94_13985 [Pedobacter yulinensis]|uniref:Heparan-alpha-glucosaminide N-acetyltransferase catalytic domain-containing protein n=1 Tax=Pedobacter yulinensis TaxID=2126353 RepID=A0A2T3HMF9_9SPHI|nr:heparan-alpha-glucosaminide N-acetyltransferase domain-containing protein [Pedobacter yulinensis]PST83642.1 hypothetical protein C7T94_13985 [Pedobacter yulinensis]